MLVAKNKVSWHENRHPGVSGTVGFRSIPLFLIPYRCFQVSSMAQWRQCTTPWHNGGNAQLQGTMQMHNSMAQWRHCTTPWHNGGNAQVHGTMEAMHNSMAQWRQCTTPRHNANAQLHGTMEAMHISMAQWRQCTTPRHNANAQLHGTMEAMHNSMAQCKCTTPWHNGGNAHLHGTMQMHNSMAQWRQCTSPWHNANAQLHGRRRQDIHPISLAQGCLITCIICTQQFFGLQVENEHCKLISNRTICHNMSQKTSESSHCR